MLRSFFVESNEIVTIILYVQYNEKANVNSRRIGGLDFRHKGELRRQRQHEVVHQSKAVQWLQPLTVEHVGFACLDVAHALGIDQPHFEAARLQQIESGAMAVPAAFNWVKLTFCAIPTSP